MALNNIKVVVFDFDGVIVDSVGIKNDAWFTLFPKGSSEESFFESTLNSLGDKVMTRYKFLREIFTKSKTSNIDEKVLEYAKKYDEITRRLIVGKNISPDNLKAIKELSKKYKLYLNSATPTDSLKNTISALSIELIFDGIMGAPKSKMENLGKIQEKENVKKDQMIFIGDAENDRKAAESFGVAFVGVRNTFNKWEDKSYPVIRNLSEVVRLLKK